MNMALLVTLAALTQVEPNQQALLATFRAEFVAITPGEGRFPATFRMGSDKAQEGPVHEVTMSQPFWMAKYEVPQNLWQAVMGSNPSRWKGPRNSVEMLDYDEAVAFCEQVTKLLREAKLIEADQVVRLPTEAEWEYCARAGTATAYSFGDAVADLGEYAWFTGNAAGNDPPVGAKQPNAWGLYDMHGYLWEWCLDVAHDDYTGAPVDGTAWMAGGDPKRRVIRGGSWKDEADSLRSAARGGKFAHRTPAGESIQLSFQGGVERHLRDDAVGLRCVLAPAAR